MKLELKHLLSYPQDLRVQYNGILNTKELSEWRKKEPKSFGFFSEEYSEWDKLQPEEIVGEKISTIKGIKFFKNYHVIKVGRSFGYGKNESTSTVKPILRSLSDLAKEIEHNGERFVPIRQLEDLFPSFEFYNDSELAILYSEQDCSGYLNHNVGIDKVMEINSKLLEWHFDIFRLIEGGLAIDVNTLNENPYETTRAIRLHFNGVHKEV